MFRTPAEARPSMAPTMSIVGNAPEMTDRADEIDTCDKVVRFNNVAGFGGHAGRRVTHLSLVNRGGQPREWVERGFSSLAAMRAMHEVILPFPPILDGPQGVCWTQPMMEGLAPFGIRVRTLGAELHDAARSALRRHGARGEPNPSTGFVVTFHLLGEGGARTRPEIFGFGFEGWDGHPWAAERSWFEAAHEAGRLRLHPV